MGRARIPPVGGAVHKAKLGGKIVSFLRSSSVREGVGEGERGEGERGEGERGEGAGREGGGRERGGREGGGRGEGEGRERGRKRVSITIHV